MKKTLILSLLIVTTFVFLSCKTNLPKNSLGIVGYAPVDKTLFDEIIAMDKEYFDAYNSCDMIKQDSLYAEEIEFFHDKGGLMTSKKELLEGIKKNICGKVTRELIKGSIEVYPINNYGAVEIGFHKFYNNQEPDALSTPSKFIIIWKNENRKWKIKKVISLHSN